MTNILSFDAALHIYEQEGVRLDSVTQILWKMGMYKGTEWFTDEAREFGKYCAMVMEFVSKERLYPEGPRLDRPNLDAALVGIAQSYESFLDVAQFTPILIEQPLSISGLGGKPDVYGRFSVNGKYAVVDGKTGGSQKCYRLQTAAYQYMLEMNGYPVDIRGSLYLQKDGTLAKWEPHSDTQDLTRWMAVFGVYNLKKEWDLL